MDVISKKFWPCWVLTHDVPLTPFVNYLINNINIILPLDCPLPCMQHTDAQYRGEAKLSLNYALDQQFHFWILIHNEYWSGNKYV